MEHPSTGNYLIFNGEIYFYCATSNMAICSERPISLLARTPGNPKEAMRPNIGIHYGQIFTCRSVFAVTREFKQLILRLLPRDMHLELEFSEAELEAAGWDSDFPPPDDPAEIASSSDMTVRVLFLNQVENTQKRRSFFNGLVIRLSFEPFPGDLPYTMKQTSRSATGILWGRSRAVKLLSNPINFQSWA